MASGCSAFARGLLTNLLNPKVGIFLVTFLPQFIPGGVALSACSFFLVSIHVLLTVVWFGLLCRHDTAENHGLVCTIDLACSRPISASIARPHH
ncbi:homoserine/Threonine efflux protein [compost metagenome]